MINYQQNIPVSADQTELRDQLVWSVSAMIYLVFVPSIFHSHRLRLILFQKPVMGHSSGAHIALLMVVDQIKRLILLEESKTMIRKEKKPVIQQSTLPYVDRFVGISGPYNISDHFDYEAARGVEELSPMKAACGYSREQFRWNSPALRLQDFLVSIKKFLTVCFVR